MTSTRLSRTVGFTTATLGTAAAAVAVVYIPPPLDLLVPAVLAGGLLLTRAGYTWWLFLTFALLSAVAWEPAPVDLLMPLVLGYGLLSGHLVAPRRNRLIVAVVAAFGLVLWNAVSLPAAPDEAAALRYAAITMDLVISGLLAMCLTDIRQVRTSMAGLVAGAAVTSTAGILVYLGALPFPELLFGGVRAMGLTKDPNVFGPLMVLAALFTVALLGEPSGRGRRHGVAAVLILVPLVAGLALSFSRGAWVNCLVAAGAYLLLRRPTASATWFRLGASVVALVGVAGVVWISIGGTDSYLASRLGLQSYDTERFANVQLGLVQFVETPVLGHGPGTDAAVLGIATHDVYIKLLVEGGLPELVLFAVLIGGALVSVAAALKYSMPGQRPLTAAVLAGLLGMLVNGAVIDTLHWRQLWVVLGMAWAACCWTAQQASEPAVKRVQADARFAHSESTRRRRPDMGRLGAT